MTAGWGATACSPIGSMPVGLGRALAGPPGEPVVVLGLARGGARRGRGGRRALAATRRHPGAEAGVPFHRELAMGASGRTCARPQPGRAGDRADHRCGTGDGRSRSTGRARAPSCALPARAAGLNLTGRTALVVDDGVATGSTACRCRVARAHGARRVVLAVPVAPLDVGGCCPTTPTRSSRSSPRNR